MPAKLHVGNISYRVVLLDLAELFMPFGVLRSIQIMHDRMTDQPKGFAFVEYGHDREAQAAVQALNGKHVDGRALSVTIAVPREDRPRKPGFGPGKPVPGGKGFPVRPAARKRPPVLGSKLRKPRPGAGPEKT